MDLGIKGAAVVVAGGAAGIGRAIAREFAQEGANIALLDINPAVAATADEISVDYGVKSVSIVADLTDYETVLSAAAQVKESLGGSSHVIFAAGAGSGKFGFPFWNLDPSDWPRILNINLIAAVNTAHAFGPLLIDKGESSLLFISSIAGQIGSQTDPPYSAAKAGLINFAMCAAKDFAAHGVRVNTVCPGMIKTDLNRSVWKAWFDSQPPEQQLDYDSWGALKVKQVAPLGRWQEPEEIGAMAVFLASKNARNITGQTINVDGGQVMHW